MCAAGMLCATALLFSGAWPDAALGGFIFCATAFAYGFAAWGIRKWPAWFFGALSVLLFFHLARTQQAVSLVAALVWGLYHGMLGPGLRRYAVAKPVSIAFVWALATVLLPLPVATWPTAGLVFIGRASFVFALALAYDLCDRHLDRLHGFTTLVQQLGTRKTIRLTDAALTMAAACAVVNWSIGLIGVAALAAVLGSLLISAWAIRMVPARTHWSVWRKMAVDGLMILQATALALTRL